MKNILMLVLTFALTACGGWPHVVKTYEIDGVKFTEHKDHPSPPERCGKMSHGSGCSINSIDGKTSTIYYSEMSPDYVLPHEQAHGFGMKHTEWEKTYFGKELCARIIVGYKQYKAGDMLCTNGGR